MTPSALFRFGGAPTAARLLFNGNGDTYIFVIIASEGAVCPPAPRGGSCAPFARPNWNYRDTCIFPENPLDDGPELTL